MRDLCSLRFLRELGLVAQIGCSGRSSIAILFKIGSPESGTDVVGEREENARDGNKLEQNSGDTKARLLSAFYQW
jgi:hypothetical protein